MKTIQIELNKTGYEPFLDYLKAFAIICVLIGHTFHFLNLMGYSFWIGMQVPLFVLIQAFHVLKKPSTKLDFKKIFLRILLPYFIILLGIVLVYLFFGKMDNRLIVKGLIGGGYGPGSYYPWIYLQLAVILYLIRPVFDKEDLIKQAVLWLVVCEGIEILESLLNVPEPIHRLLAVRYLFLIYLAWIWVKKGIVINKSTLLLSVLSLLSIVYFEYCNFNNEPLFFDTAWKYHRWPCYFYVSTLLCYLLYTIYKYVSQVRLIDRIVQFLAKCSYEIFLVQMAVIPILPKLSFINNKYIALSLWISIVWAISLVGGYLFNTIYSNFLKRIK